jgi:hypothetical protein
MAKLIYSAITSLEGGIVRTLSPRGVPKRVAAV